jgi:serine/threonine protein kinase
MTYSFKNVYFTNFSDETNPVLDSLYFTCDALDTFSILRYTDEPLSRCDTYQYTQLGSAEQSLVSKTNMTDTTLNTSRRRCGTRGNVINLEIYKMKRLCLNQPEWYSISDHAKDLLHQLLTPNAKRRVTASEALRHPWFSIEKNVI